MKHRQEAKSQKSLWMDLCAPESDHALKVRGATEWETQERSRGHPLHLHVPLRETEPVALKRPREGATHEKAKKLRHIMLPRRACPSSQYSPPGLLPQEVDRTSSEGKAQRLIKRPAHDVTPSSPNQGPGQAEGSGVQVAVVGGVGELGKRVEGGGGTGSRRGPSRNSPWDPSRANCLILSSRRLNQIQGDPRGGPLLRTATSGNNFRRRPNIGMPVLCSEVLVPRGVRPHPGAVSALG